jgi:large subunit ribosomal protein L28
LEEEEMSRICEISGKRPTVVNSVTRRGKAKADGGVGKKTTGISKRWQYSNLQKVNITVAGQEITFRVATSYVHKVYELAERAKGMQLEGLTAKQIKAKLLQLV